MATLIRFKRKKSTSNNGVTLKTGEPYYNAYDKRLYVGNNENDSISSTKKHIAEVTVVDSSGRKIQIGEDPKNIIDLSSITTTWKDF